LEETRGNGANRGGELSLRFLCSLPFKSMNGYRKFHDLAHVDGEGRALEVVSLL